MRTNLFRRRSSGPPPAATPGPVDAPPTTSCYAPTAALYLQPDGVVRACCATAHISGRVTGPGRQPVEAIWRGAAQAAQAAALAVGDHSYGCQECELNESAGGRSASLAHEFDRFGPGAPHEWPQLIDFALSSRCNLQCVMCNGSLSSSIRTQREQLPPLPSCYDDRFFEELEPFLPHLVRTHFKGGEPFLARENRRIWDRLIDLGLHPEVSVTTNATLFNANVERYVTALAMHPIISVDAMDAATLESIRVGVDAPTLWANVDRFQELGEQTGQGLTLSFCLMTVNWRELAPFLRETERRGVVPNVVYVNQPHRYDLLRLPHDDLRDVLDALDRVDPGLHQAGTQRIWHEALARLRTQLEHPVELVVRSHAAPTAPAGAGTDPAGGSAGEVVLVDALAPEHEQALRARLAAAGSVPLAFEAVDGVVTGVEAPDWAAWLAPGSWVGHALSNLAPVVEAAAGPLVPAPMPPDQVGVERIDLHIDTAAGRRTLQLHLFTSAADGCQRGLLVEA